VRRALPVALLVPLCTASALAPSAPPPSAAAAPPALYAVSDAALDGLQPLLRATLDANRKEFRGRTGVVRGFGAGTLYPQVWLRDSATLIPLSRYLYARDHLVSWIEEHLAHQRPDGALNDWVAAGPPERFTSDAPRASEVYRAAGVILTADRNTSESDQESSAVDAVAQVYAITGDRAWLTRPVAGRPLIDRLDAALAFVRTRRWDRHRGLVTAAFTADWGDVTPTYGDQRAIYLDDHTPVVASLYASALFLRAQRALGVLHRAAGDEPGGRRWEERARLGAQAIDRELWQSERGFFRPHVLLSWPGPGTPPADDDDRFALGGNAVALVDGLGDEDRVRRVLSVATARARAQRLSTLSGVLLPPYPAGFFRHPIQRESYAYQNGGQWDWFGGRLLLAAFERGQAQVARRELGRIAAQAVRNRGLFEWSTRDGQGRGSGRYAGSAGALGAAVLAGLYGIDLGHDGLALRVRLADLSGRIQLTEPATGASVAYEYACDAARRVARLTYRASVRGPGTVEVLLPPGRTAARARLDGGAERTLDERTVGDDRYVGLRTDWAPHRLELALR
jgi:mannosylglycerate hydrolase MGH1-like protein